MSRAFPVLASRYSSAHHPVNLSNQPQDVPVAEQAKTLRQQLTRSFTSKFVGINILRVLRKTVYPRYEGFYGK